MTAITKDLRPNIDHKPELRFHFKSAGLEMEAVAEITATGTAVVHMKSEIGIIPFSAEGREARTLARAIVVTSAGMRPVRFAETRNGRVVMAGEQTIKPPVTPQNIFAASAAMVVRAKPFIDALKWVVKPVEGR